MAPAFKRMASASLALAALFVMWPLNPSQGSSYTQTTNSIDGRALFLASCASCHGAGAAGTELGPSLIGVGEASVDFQLRTGRMPLADPTSQTIRKPPAFDEQEIEALVVYVGSLGDGPAIPRVDVAGGDVSDGQGLFVANCAPCHGASGNGGAVGAGALAPSLHRSTPLDVAEAMVAGPGEMPVFAFPEDELDDIVAFVRFLQTAPRPGGADIGGVGPVPEGFVAWGVGVAALVGACVLLGSKRSRSR